MKGYSHVALGTALGYKASQVLNVSPAVAIPVSVLFAILPDVDTSISTITGMVFKRIPRFFIPILKISLGIALLVVGKYILGSELTLMELYARK